ncbi:triose-phosphate isomerase [bacterium]|jgi:triosephosphate isomerase|nr:triose-phosphate isomerase [bacterium]
MRNIVAGNWKSNKLMNEGIELMDAITKGLPTLHKTEVIVAPPAPYLAQFSAQYKGNAVHLSAQQCSEHGHGAHTGEYTAEMLRSSGVTHVIIGHSERRDRFGESFEVVQSKVNQAIGASLHVLLCCGEPLEVRESEEHFELISKQLKDALADVDSAKMANITIAYEPVWAIGTGVTASADQAQEMHQFIREQLGNWFNPQVASTTRILYGGSCKPSNAAEIFGQPDVNGGLIGGAALEASSFLSLVAASEAS